MSIRTEIYKAYMEDPEGTSARAAAGEWDHESELFSYEITAMKLTHSMLEELKEELDLLREQLSDDKEVRYVLETVEIEGLFYTMVHKFDVGGYLGYTSTCAKLAKMLKAANHTMFHMKDVEN